MKMITLKPNIHRAVRSEEKNREKSKKENYWGKNPKPKTPI